jgi:c-di-GMP-binding flagellar brake protein YcgR
MESKDPREGRKTARVPIDELVSFTPFEGSSSLGQGVDVSLDGIRFRVVGCQLAHDEMLQVSVNVANQTIEAVGRVVRLQQLDDITTEVSLEFVRIDPWASRMLEREMEAVEARQERGSGSQGKPAS